MESEALSSISQQVLGSMQEIEGVINRLQTCIENSHAQGIIDDTTYNQLSDTLFAMNDSFSTHRNTMDNVQYTSPVFPELNDEAFAPTFDEMNSIYASQSQGNDSSVA